MISQTILLPVHPPSSSSPPQCQTQTTWTRKINISISNKISIKIIIKIIIKISIKINIKISISIILSDQNLLSFLLLLFLSLPCCPNPPASLWQVWLRTS